MRVLKNASNFNRVILSLPTLEEIKNEIHNFTLKEVNLKEVNLKNELGEFDLLFNEVHGIKISILLLVTINIIILSFIFYLYFENLKKLKDKIKYYV